LPDSINYNDLSTNCNDSNCYRCDTLYPDLCLKCGTGFFLYGKTCEYECPKNYVADVLRQKCIRIEEIDSSSIFLKTYTKGSCLNQCGKVSIEDCSCSRNCKNSGTCCYDYTTVNCDGIYDKGKSVEEECKQINPNCDLCDRTEKVNSRLKCNLCRDKFYLYKGDCLEVCPDDTKSDDINYVCNDIKCMEKCLF
jgi:hypothetical protein